MVNRDCNAGSGAGKSGRTRFWNSGDNVADISEQTLWDALDVVLGKEELRDITAVGFTRERLAKVLLSFPPRQCAHEDRTFCNGLHPFHL